MPNNNVGGSVNQSIIKKGLISYNKLIYFWNAVITADQEGLRATQDSVLKTDSFTRREATPQVLSFQLTLPSKMNNFYCLVGHWTTARTTPWDVSIEKGTTYPTQLHRVEALVYKNGFEKIT